MMIRGGGVGLQDKDLLGGGVIYALSFTGGGGLVLLAPSKC